VDLVKLLSTCSWGICSVQERVVGPEAGVSDTAEALHGPSEAVSLSDQPDVGELWHCTD